MPPKIDLGDLDLLVRVGEVGSIGKAAAEMGFSQPHASRRLQALERSLGLLLLERSKRGAALTSCGRLVVGWSEDLLSSERKFWQLVELVRRKSPMTLSVAASMTVAEYYAPAWLFALRQTEPRASIALSVHNSTDVCGVVARGEASLGLIETPTVDAALRHSQVSRDVLAVGVAPGHPWCDADAVTAADIATADLLVRERGSGTRETLEIALERHSLETSVALEMASNTALKEAAIAGIGPVVVSRKCLEPDLAAGRLVEIPVVDLDLRRPISAVWRKGEELHPWASALLAHAAGQVKSAGR